MGKNCERCGASSSWINPLADDHLCNKCWGEDRAKAEAARKEEAVEEKARKAEAKSRRESQRAASTSIILTTEASHNLPVAQRLDIVTAEVVIGMHLFKDIGAVFRDVFGGRSETMQRGLKDARKAALAELRLEAFELGADAVVGIDLDYSEISGGGKSMLFLVASGTAVKLHPSA